MPCAPKYHLILTAVQYSVSLLIILSLPLGLARPFSHNIHFSKLPLGPVKDCTDVIGYNDTPPITVLLHIAQF